MDVSRAAPGQPVASATITYRFSVLTTLLIGLVALLPRILSLNDFLTTDEAYHWIGRTERFSAAIGAGRWAETIQTGHPGVTVMWLGSLGLALERWAVAAGWAQIPTRLEHLAWLRFPVALLHALLIPVGYVLLRRLVRPTTALTAALLWATSPWLVAYGRILHLDMLLTNFVFISILLLLADDAQQAAGSGQRALSFGSRFWLLGSGVFAGLALLTKGPALILLPVAGLIMLVQCRLQLVAWLRRTTPGGQRVASLLALIAQLLGRYLIWLGVALAVVFALWPALWADPARALGSYFGEIIGNGGRPNGDGQFFLGVAVGDPGPLFYPVALLFRLTPLEMLGLLALLGWAMYAVRGAIVRASFPGVTRHPSSTLLALALFIAFWLLVMTLGPKKFDRYVLPIWPALLVFAAAGLTRIVDWVWVRAQGAGRRAQDVGAQRPAPTPRAWAQGAAPLLVCLLHVPLLIWYHPYYLSYYNPVLGGGAVAQRNLLIGWGEGMDQVGAYLRTRPDIGGGQLVSALPPTLQPFVPVPVRDALDLDQAPANYAVAYLESIQRGAAPEIYERIRQTVPLHRVTIHGIEYAEIYQLPKPYAQPLAAQFGTGLRLRGISLEQTPQRLVLTPAWDVRAEVGGDYLLFVHVLDQQGRRVAQIAVPPGGAALAATGTWQPGEQIAVPLPFDLPPGLPGGTYTLVMGLFDQTSGARLPLVEGQAADPATAGPDALLLTSITLP